MPNIQYRVRQVADCFVLEQLVCNQWQIIEQGYGWNYAQTTAYLHNCEII